MRRTSPSTTGAAAGFGLTPLYDVLSAWPIIGNGPNKLPYQRAKLAMALRGANLHYRLRDIQARHWERLAHACGPGVWDRMVGMAESVERTLDRVEARLPDGFPARTWAPINAGVRRHAQHFLQVRRGDRESDRLPPHDAATRSSACSTAARLRAMSRDTSGLASTSTHAGIARARGERRR